MSRPFGLTAPCVDCPFLVARAFPLTKARRQEIAQSLLRGESFPCHKTVIYADGDEEGEYRTNRSDEVHCAGALVMLEQAGKPNQMMRIAERLRMYDHTKLDMDADVYPSFAAFMGGPS